MLGSKLVSRGGGLTECAMALEDEVFEEEESEEVSGDPARHCHPDYVRGRRIDNACGASPATLHLFESRMKPRRNVGMQAHVDITRKRFHKRLKIVWISI